MTIMNVASRLIDFLIHSDMGEEDIFDPTSVSNGGWDQNHTAPTRFLQIYTTAQKDPLEITPDHLLYVQEDSSYPVPVGSMKVGDLLVSTSFPPPRVLSKSSR
eukprot:scaffold64477_cov52-Attheya_sp.AAC.2